MMRIHLRSIHTLPAAELGAHPGGDTPGVDKDEVIKIHLPNNSQQWKYLIPKMSQNLWEVGQ